LITGYELPFLSNTRIALRMAITAAPHGDVTPERAGAPVMPSPANTNARPSHSLKRAPV
jgi:hypothetical protein